MDNGGSDHQAVTFELLRTERTGSGWSVDVLLTVADVEIAILGATVTVKGGNASFDMPKTRGADGRWRAAVELHQGLVEPISREVFSALGLAAGPVVAKVA